MLGLVSPYTVVAPSEYALIWSILASDAMFPRLKAKAPFTICETGQSVVAQLVAEGGIAWTGGTLTIGK